MDRTELSKNIVRGLEAYRELLHRYPQWRGEVVHLAFAYPSRHDLPVYREYTGQVQRLAQEVNDEFARPGWEPVVLNVLDDYPRSLAAYRLADVLLVNPVRDGMNLVAKEAPVLSDNGLRAGALPRGGRGGRAGGRRAAGQPVRRVRAPPTRWTARCRWTRPSAPTAPPGWPRPRPRCPRSSGSTDQLDALGS